jgi:signal transduction histidine kinase
MNRFFVRIFLWLWLAMTMIGAILVVIALTSNPWQSEKERREKELTPYGEQLIDALEARGRNGVMEEIQRLNREKDLRLVLYHPDTGPIAARELSPEFKEAIVREVTAEQKRSTMDETSPRRRPGRALIHLDKGYVLLAMFPPPSRLEILLSPRSLILRIAVTFVMAGITCFILARSLTAPIAKLRKATQDIADGNLATRVEPLIGQKMGDITDLAKDFDRMAERVEKLLTSQQRLLRDISHELRSPLTRLNVALALAQQQSAPEADSSLARIELESERLSELIGQLRTFNLLESGTEKLEQKPVPLHDLLRLVVRDADFEAHSCNRSVSITSSEEATVYGSWEMLRQAIENVVRNAVRYTDEKTAVAISLQVNKQGDQRQACIEVSDHGPGVPEEQIPLLFKPFYRVDEARDRERGGSGMGLAIAERAIHLHQGTISIHNAAEGGLKIEIFLPLPAELIPRANETALPS